MTIRNSIEFLEGLKSETTQKSEIKIYNQFIDILEKLQKRAFDLDEMQSIETELDNLNLKSNPEKRKKHFQRILHDFKKYLKDTFSLVTTRYYTTLYGGLGLIGGLLFGVVFLSNLERSQGISYGLIGGMLVGSIIGQYMDTKAIKEGKVL